MKKAYFIGIKGVGMTALALAMQDAGWQIVGSDTTEEFITDDILLARGIKISTPVDSPVPADTSLIVYSTAYTPPKTDLPVLSLAEALADFVKARQVIAVAGVGGKTTTSAMLAALFQAAGHDVGYYVGTSTIAGLDAPGHNGTDPYYIVESDEYAISKSDQRPKFALLSPQILVTTNIVHDHPDIYPDEEATLSAFRTLILRLPSDGSWVYNSSDRLSRQLAQDPGLKCRLLPYHAGLPPLNLSVFGSQNQLDAQAAVLTASAARVPPELAKKAIQTYRGAGRRQESHGEAAGRLLYDDYGHHPAEIEVTVKSFKEHFPGKRLLLVFESHTYTRTEALLSDFARAIATADLPFIMPIFESAREKGQPHSITPQSFASEVAKYNPAATGVTWDNAAEQIISASRPGDIILTMGAGFVYKLHKEFIRLLK